jgi:hypothetical protein
MRVIGKTTFPTAREDRRGRNLNTWVSSKMELKVVMGNITYLDNTSMLESLKIINFQGRALLLFLTDRYTLGIGSEASTMGLGLITGETTQFTKGIL